MEPSKGAHMVNQSLSLKVGQDDEYVMMKSFNSEEEYEVISFRSDGELLKDQKTSPPATVNKFYPEIQSMEKEYSPELWNAAYENILGTLQEEVTSIEYEKRIALLR